MKTVFKRAICALLLLSCVFSLASCFTPSRKMYLSKEKNASPDKVTALLSSAQGKNDSLDSIKYSYSYFVECEIEKGEILKLGTQNVITIKNRNGENPLAHRKNTSSSLLGETIQQTESESFYFSDGKVYAKEFGKNYYSDMDFDAFLPYTYLGVHSVDTNFLNPALFSNATIYNRFGDVTEICFRSPAKDIESGIISFIGFDQTEYVYTLEDVILTIIIDENGYLAERHLTFSVDYYDESLPDNVLTYEGDFAYTLDQTESDKITVEQRNKADNYTYISNIQLLPSVTAAGYITLYNQSSLDVSYSKWVQISSSGGDVFTFETDSRIISSFEQNNIKYSSIDTGKLVKYGNIEAFSTAGAFIDESGYKERVYDYKKGEYTSNSDRAEHDYTELELKKIIFDTISAEQLHESEIYAVTLKSEDESSITYSINFTTDATRNFTAYLYDTFSDGETTLNTSAFSYFLPRQCDVYVTVRKSDGCILKQTMDFKAEFGIAGISGYITVEGNFDMTVNSTSAPDTYLSVQDHENTVSDLMGENVA